MVILCDYLHRKFQVRTPQHDETPDPKVQTIETAIVTMKTKLDATQARIRIKNSIPSLENVLPVTLQEHEMNARKMHVCCWVNKLKTK